ncbi:hypothetical protein [Tardiphaga sp.]|jgi:hypothetical protein|uniref:hypothetical protein n=1 Tax=Tardiphaga sp. TaxID=1926292 RepID=UPI0019845A11|nr:hypothetical protein [Tardiphaga sp.]MBC7579806.1 hypothetical protein [Tardiphaga sp.]
MDTTYFSALIALAGATLGGLTTVATTWVTQHVLLHRQTFEKTRASREKLYVAFMEETARLFADALGHQRDDVNDLVRLYVLVARMRLVATPSVIVAAETVVRRVIDAYQAPNRSLHELRLFADEGGMDPLLSFSELCRYEIQNL